MGHDLPRDGWPEIVDAIAENAAREEHDMNRPPSIGETIRRQRELNQVSMRQFADMAGISNPYLSQIERGLREPSERVLEAIAESLETSADALYEQAGIVVQDGSETAAARAAIEADPALTPRASDARCSRSTTRSSPRVRRPARASAAAACRPRFS